MNFENKVAIVTGAAGAGMGRSIALTLAREGAKVVVNYRTSETQARAIVESIRAKGGNAVPVQADIFTPEGCQRLVEAACQSFGQVDICVIGPGGGWHPEPLVSLAPAEALDDLHSDVAPLFYLLPLVLPGMLQRGWGRIIGITMNPGKISPAYAYNVGKAARTQGLLLAQDQAWANGVTINILAPGPISGLESLEEAIDQCAHGEGWRGRGNVSPQDIAEGAAFLCSEAGRFITGSILAYSFH